MNNKHITLLGSSIKDLNDAKIIVLHVGGNEKSIQNLDNTKITVLDVNDDNPHKMNKNDVQIVIQCTNCTEEEAQEALKYSDGDIIEAVMKLKPDLIKNKEKNLQPKNIHVRVQSVSDSEEDSKYF